MKNSSGKDPGKCVCVRVREDMFFACGLCVCVCVCVRGVLEREMQLDRSGAYALKHVFTYLVMSTLLALARAERIAEARQVRFT
jgi:hypothetical protein